ncbi:hypothetical protein [Glutamicibacter sp. 0426]|uniref:hypothetical protein n=1 Tax=Glutamicibacter sp. 0426 TaxID=1913445 RepID=UPI001E3692E5|nr:hypothetical protein [Glutamicibacter sp. 0426]
MGQQGPEHLDGISVIEDAPRFGQDNSFFFRIREEELIEVRTSAQRITAAYGQRKR